MCQAFLKDWSGVPNFPSPEIPEPLQSFHRFPQRSPRTTVEVRFSHDGKLNERQDKHGRN